MVLVLAMVLLLMLAYAPEACLAQQDASEKALAILRDVVGLDVATYRARLDSHTQDLFRDSLPQESLSYTLEADGNKLDVFFNFVDGKLQHIGMSVNEGLPLMLQTVQPAANEVEMAKGFLSRYQAYCGAAHVEAFKAILDTVEAKTNITKVSGNIKFEAEYAKSVDVENRTIDIATFRWIYTFNGAVSSSRWVALIFVNEHLDGFVDNWDLFKIGSYDINVDEEKAIEIAMNAAKNYSYKVYMGRDKDGNEIWIEVKDFKIVEAKVVALMFSNSLWKWEARDGDPLTEYPMWIIDLYFDGVYPGNVYGVYVKIWADTGEVREIVTMTSGLGEYPSPSDGSGADSGDQTGGEDYAEQEPIETDNASNNGTGLNLTQIAWIALPISVGIALATVKVYSRRKKRAHKGNVACQKYP